MKTKSWLIVIIAIFITRCSSSEIKPHVSVSPKIQDRSIASLDNNADTLLDPTLESRTDPQEEQKFDKVAAVIAAFVKKQSELRDQHKEDKVIHGDLPQTTEDGAPLAPAEKNKYATRDVHRKTHGCYTANLVVSKTIQEDLNNQIEKFISERQTEAVSSNNPMPEKISSPAQLGVFQPGYEYDAIVRYSNGHPGYQHDKEPDARGMAVKILPKGTLVNTVDRLETSYLAQSTVLDILSINFPTFFVNDPVKYQAINESFLKGAQDFKNKFIAQALQGKAILGSDMTPLEIKLALLSNGSIIETPLFQKYFSMVPSRLGNRGEARAVKYSWVPVACEGSEALFEEEKKYEWSPWTQQRDYALLTRTGWAKLTAPPAWRFYKHDYLREHANHWLLKNSMCFALTFQLYRDQASTNIEDSTDIWLSDKADLNQWNKMLKVGINIPAQKEYEKNLMRKKFSPYIRVATLKIGKISSDYPSSNTKTCEDLSFNPWNGNIEIHKPLGIVSRMKRRVYNASRHTRNDINSVKSREWERH